MDELPFDCLNIITDFLDISSILRLQQCNKNFHSFFQQNRKYIYECKLKEDFGIQNTTAEETYKKLYKIDFNGEYVIDNKLIFENGIQIDQTYIADVKCDNDKLTAFGKVDEEMEFTMDGKRRVWDVKGKIYFTSDSVNGETEFEGKVNVEKYLRSGVIEINATYKYTDNNSSCIGTTKCTKLV